VAFQSIDDRLDRLETLVATLVAEGERERAAREKDRADHERDRADHEKDRADHERTRLDHEQDRAEMRQWRVDSQKKWGEIAQKLGTFVEDIVAPNIPRIGEELFRLGAGTELFSGPRLRLQHPKDPARVREFDYVYATKVGWIIVESKSNPKLNDVDAFRELIADAPEFFPQFAATPLFPIFASLYLPDHVVKYCSRHGIYALGMGAETMEILNLADLPVGSSGA
jgi:hypothetical protein